MKKDTTICNCKEEYEIIGHREVKNKINISLIKIGMRGTGWIDLYKCKSCKTFWEKSYPEGVRHDVGPPHLKKVDNEYIVKNYSTSNATIEKNEI